MMNCCLSFHLSRLAACLRPVDVSSFSFALFVLTQAEKKTFRPVLKGISETCNLKAEALSLKPNYASKT